MTKEGSPAWYYEQAIRLRVLATKAANPQIQSELMQAAARFRVLASDIEISAAKNRRAREALVAAGSAAELTFDRREAAGASPKR